MHIAKKPKRIDEYLLFVYFQLYKFIQENDLDAVGQRNYRAQLSAFDML